MGSENSRAICSFFYNKTKNSRIWFSAAVVVIFRINWNRPLIRFFWRCKAGIPDI